jgi:hypothetical protein
MLDFLHDLDLRLDGFKVISIGKELLVDYLDSSWCVI